MGDLNRIQASDIDATNACDRGRPYLVTGGAGFIGSHLVDALLAAGHAVRVLDDLSTGHHISADPNCSFIRGDVCDAPTVRRAMAGVAGCFHLAAIASVMRSNEDWLGTHRCNQAGTVAVLDAARREGRVPVVYASSAAVYGNAGDGPVAEHQSTMPLTAYGADKLGSEIQARIAFGVHGVPTLGLRFFNVYGPRQDPSSPYSGVISIFARRIAAGQPICIYGDGEQTRDFVFVGDVVRHLTSGMQHLHAEPGAGVQNVCTGKITTIYGLAQLMMDICETSAEISFGATRAGDIRHSQGNPQSTIDLLKVQASTPLEAGLRILLAYDDVSEAEMPFMPALNLAAERVMAAPI